MLSCYLFKVTDSSRNQPRRITEELIRARSRGVDVTVLLEQESNGNDRLNDDNRHTAELLSRSGIRVRFDAPGRISHLKLVMIDNRYVYIGSHNLTQSALKYNNELSVLINSPEMAAEIRAYLDRL